MLQDSQLQLAALQSLIAAAGDIASTNYLDTGAAQDEGIGESAYLVARIGTAVLSAGAATLQPVLQSATDAAFTTPDEYPMTGAIAKAALTANTVIARMRLPLGLKRYLRVVWRIGTATTTAGTGDAFIVKDVDAQQYLPKNFTVS